MVSFDHDVVGSGKMRLVRLPARHASTRIVH